MSIQGVARARRERLQEIVRGGAATVIEDLFESASLHRISTVEGACAELGAMPLDVRDAENRVLGFMDFSELVEGLRRDDGKQQIHSSDGAVPEALLSRYPLGDLETADPQVYLGPRGRAVRLHWNVDQRATLLHQVFGRKLVIVIHPRQSEKLDANAETSALLLERFSERDLELFAAFTSAEATILGPGETLFIPAAHWHFVRYLDLALSVAHRLGRSELVSRFVLLGAPPTPDVQLVGHLLSSASVDLALRESWVRRLERIAGRAAAERVGVECLFIREELEEEGQAESFAYSVREIERRDRLRRLAPKLGFDALYEAMGLSAPVLERVFVEVYGDRHPVECQPNGFCTRDEVASVREALRPTGGTELVDVGCGTAGLGLALARALGLRYLGVEPSAIARAIALERAAKLGAGGAQILDGTFERIPLEDRRARAVVSFDVIQLAPNKPAALREIARVLEPGGRFVFTTWQGAGMEYGPLLVEAGFAVESLQTSIEPIQVQIALYEAIVKNARALREELGGGARMLLYEARTEPERLRARGSKRLMAVARKL